MAKVLVIEDDETLRRMLCRAMRKAGHFTLDAENGRRGVEIAKREDPAVVITDIVMPEQDGIETIIELRRLNRTPAIIAISGVKGLGFDPLVDALIIGADQVFTKPLALDALLGAVDEMIARPS